jgi:hypothetical protein
MISLQPQEQFTIVRQLPDPSDATTYYVRAVVKDSVTDTILKTVNLTDKGSRRFKVAYEVPADVSGLGFYIDITTSVYTDSGYTTKSTTYSEELESYLVYDRTKKGGGGGGGADIDYKKIQKMLDALIEKFVPCEKTDLTPVLDGIQAIKKEIGAIEIPEMPEIEKIDLLPVIKAIENSEKTIVKSIDNKEVTESTDIEPILMAISNGTSAGEEQIAKLQDTVDEINDGLKTQFQASEDTKKAEFDAKIATENKMKKDTRVENLLKGSERGKKLL